MQGTAWPRRACSGVSILAGAGAHPVALPYAASVQCARHNTRRDSYTLGIGPDNLFAHMTGLSDMAWNRVKTACARVSMASPSGPHDPYTVRLCLPRAA